MSTKGWSAAGVQKWVASLERHMTHPVGKHSAAVSSSSRSGVSRSLAASHPNETAGIINGDANFVMQQQVILLFKDAVLSDIYLFSLTEERWQVWETADKTAVYNSFPRGKKAY